MAKILYFVHDKKHSVVTVKGDLAEQERGPLESMGYVECSNEEYFKARWLLWNETSVIDIEGPEKKKGKRQ